MSLTSSFAAGAQAPLQGFPHADSDNSLLSQGSSQPTSLHSCSAEAERGILCKASSYGGDAAQLSKPMISFNGVLGHGGKTECFSAKAASSSKERFCGSAGRTEGFSTTATLSRERFSQYGDRFKGLSRNCSSFGEVICGDDRFFSSSSGEKPCGHGDRVDGLFTKAPSPGEKSSKHGRKSEEFFVKGSSLEKKSAKQSKRKEARKDKEETWLQVIHKEENLPVEAEMALLKMDEMEEKSQVVDGDSASWTNDDRCLLASALDKLEALRLHALALEQWHSSSLIHVHRKYQKSAQNLLHYVALKSVDLRDWHAFLPTLGLASIEGIEGHVLTSLTRVIDAARALSLALASHSQVKIEDPLESKLLWKYRKQLNNSSLVGQDACSEIDTLSTISAGRSRLDLSHNTAALFGPRSSQRKTYIMVTLSEEMAGNEPVVLDLLKGGMDIARINCAHGNPEIWGSIIQTVKHCSQVLEQPCRVLMDLAGPKLRTSAFPPGPCVQKIKPYRDGFGKVVLPARVWIALPGTPVPEGMSTDAIIPVKGDIWLGSLQIGDQVKLRDAQGNRRQLTVTDKIMGSNGVGCWAECFQTTYLESGTKLEFSGKKSSRFKGYVADLPCLEHFIKLKKGDLLVLTKESSFLDADAPDAKESRISRIQVSHTFGQLFESVRPGELIRFDDGRIEGVIRGVTSSEICVEVTFASEKGTKLGGEKSINLPDSNLRHEGLTVKDMIDLDFVVGHADMVGLSFVNDSQDVRTLQQALQKKGATSIGVVLKIETRSGVANLTEILLQGMKNENPLGVMIARGDLAVECGWETVAGLQEDVLRVCKAAHIPTIWATQVLEGLAKQGLPTRPEITDAALGGRASCVMLNKGPHILKAVSVLEKILDNSVSPWWETHGSKQLFGISSLAD